MNPNQSYEYHKISLLVLVMILLIIATFISKPNSDVPNPTPIPTLIPESNYLAGEPVGQRFEEACSFRSQRLGFGSTGYVVTVDDSSNPTIVTIQASMVVKVDDYFVNFHPTMETVVFKFGTVISGAERNEAIEQALEETGGVVTLVAKYQIEYGKNSYTIYGYECLLP
jgi:hypothetical protein